MFIPNNPMMPMQQLQPTMPNPYMMQQGGMYTPQQAAPNYFQMGGVQPPMMPQPMAASQPGFFQQLQSQAKRFLNAGVQFAQRNPVATAGGALGLSGAVMGCPYSAAMGVGSIMMGLATNNNQAQHV